MPRPYRRALSSESILGDQRLTYGEIKKRVWLAAFITIIISLCLAFTLWCFGFLGKTSKSLSQKEVALDYYSRQYNKVHQRHSRGFLSVKKMNAVILILCRNEDLAELLVTLNNFEERFNKRFKYPYVLLNDEEFTRDFKTRVRRINSMVQFGQISAEQWSIPPHINQTKAIEHWKDMEHRNVIYGGSKSYRQMCRFFSGGFYDHPLIQPFDYYWRVEPGVQFLCNIPYDPFFALYQERKKYGFVISLHEIPETIPTLWQATLDFINKNPNLISQSEHCLEYFMDSDGQFNNCHFWSNFEIADLSFFRSQQYRAYFKHLDDASGFFYERWGDAPVHSLAVGLFLSKDEVMYFDDIGYRHEPLQHCPADSNWRRDQNCECNPFETSDVTHSECQHRWSNLEAY